jgi:hypothetical protein
MNSPVSTYAASSALYRHVIFKDVKGTKTSALYITQKAINNGCSSVPFTDQYSLLYNPTGYDKGEICSTNKENEGTINFVCW